MTVGILITNGGPHPAIKLAEMNADQLIQIELSAAPDLRASGLELRAMFIAILEGFHEQLQLSERSALEEDTSRLLIPTVADQTLIEDTLTQLCAAAQATQFGEHYRKESVREAIRKVLAQYFRISMDIERSWCADRNPNDTNAKTYKQTRQAAPL